jgi:hypothetical protein
MQGEALRRAKSWRPHFSTAEPAFTTEVGGLGQAREAARGPISSTIGCCVGCRYSSVCSSAHGSEGWRGCGSLTRTTCGRKRIELG